MCVCVCVCVCARARAPASHNVQHSYKMCRCLCVCYPTLNKEENEFESFLISYVRCVAKVVLLMCCRFLHTIRGCCAFCVYMYVYAELFHLAQSV